MTEATLRVATYNIGPDSDAEAIRKTLKLMEDYDALGLCETGARDGMMRALRQKFHVLYSKEMNQKRIALVLNKQRFSDVGAHWYLMNEGGYVGPGAGPDRQYDRYMLWATALDTVTRRRYWFAVKHLVASIQNPRRDKEAEEDIRRTCRILDDHPKYACFTVGDFNMEPDHNNLAPLRKRMDETAMEFGKPWPDTHDKRHIDHVWFRDKPYLRLVKQEVIPENPADHDAYGVTFRVKVRSKVAATLRGEK